MQNPINITGVDMTKLVNAVYDLSRPVGMGFLHFKEGALPADDLESIIKHANAQHTSWLVAVREQNINGKHPSFAQQRSILSLDYVNGRQCKMNVWCDYNDQLWIENPWYDHSASQLSDLLAAIGIEPPANLADARVRQEHYND